MLIPSALNFLKKNGEGGVATTIDTPGQEVTLGEMTFPTT